MILAISLFPAEIGNGSLTIGGNTLFVLAKKWNDNNRSFYKIIPIRISCSEILNIFIQKIYIVYTFPNYVVFIPFVNIFLFFPLLSWREKKKKRKEKKRKEKKEMEKDEYK